MAAIQRGGYPERRLSRRAAIGTYLKGLPLAAVTDGWASGWPPSWLAAVPVLIRGTCARKTGDSTLDLGGIAKGFAVDRAVEAIQRLSHGCLRGGVVNAGGDLRAWGDAPAPAAVLIHSRATTWARPFAVRDSAVASSAPRAGAGSLERFSPAVHVRMTDGKAAAKTRPVTVFAGRCLWADALAKVALLGSARTAAQCLKRYRAKALVFTSQGRLAEVMG